jgi:predicted metal-dependent peptidase
MYFNLNAKTNKNAQCIVILYTDPFLDAFAKFRRATIIFVVCPSIRTEQLGSHWTDFHII